MTAPLGEGEDCFMLSLKIRIVRERKTDTANTAVTAWEIFGASRRTFGVSAARLRFSHLPQLSVRSFLRYFGTHRRRASPGRSAGGRLSIALFSATVAVTPQRGSPLLCPRFSRLGEVSGAFGLRCFRDSTHHDARLYRHPRVTDKLFKESCCRD